ncbi:MAG: SpoIVB peptidase S55 domain-containing protein [Myxococcales bacterium]
MPLSEVRPGMVGEALTVFQGTKPEPFKVRVISIMRQFLPKQDVILIRAEDPRVEFSGIAAGMSGSPVYIGGRLMGAIAYGWSFSKEPLGGVTPIETMLAERNRPRRSNRDLFTEIAPDGLRTLTLAEGGAGGSAVAVAAVSAGAGAIAGATEPHLVRVAVPLSISGFDPRVMGELPAEFRAEGLVPVQGAGVGGLRRRNDKGAGRLQPGSAIGIELVRGDMSMVGTGTVTYVDHDGGVLAFGHPMFGAGEIYLPLVEAEIHAILPSVSQSMKLSSPVREVGALVQDRQSCVVGDLGARATMVPITVRISGPGAPPRVFRAEVARNRRLTPVLASLVISNALMDAEPDVAEMVVAVKSTVGIRGRKPLELRDEIFAPEGVSRLSLAGTRGVRALGDLLGNPFQPVILDRLDVEVRVEYRRDVAEIVAVSLPGDEVRPGEAVRLRVTLRPYNGAEYTEIIPVVIPRTLAGGTTRIEVAAGSVAKPDTVPAESLSTYVDNFRRYFAPMSIVVGVQTADDGAALHGRLLPDLPGAAADTLRPGNQTRRAEAYRVVDRTVHPTTRLVTGRQEITVYVRDDVLGSLHARDQRR